MSYAIFQCVNGLCRFRFPGSLKDLPNGGYDCPACGDRTQLAVPQPHVSDFAQKHEQEEPLAHVELLLDNTRSLYNVGSIFRTADGAGVQKLHLCGITGRPDHPKFEKTALGSDLHWAYYLNGVDAAKSLKTKGYEIWALEDAPNTISLFDVSDIQPDQKIILVLGNEVIGVDPDILKLCDRILKIPMLGSKRSLNVTIACGVALYHLMHAIKG